MEAWRGSPNVRWKSFYHCVSDMGGIIWAVAHTEVKGEWLNKSMSLVHWVQLNKTDRVGHQSLVPIYQSSFIIQYRHLSSSGVKQSCEIIPNIVNIKQFFFIQKGWRNRTEEHVPVIWCKCLCELGLFFFFYIQWSSSPCCCPDLPLLFFQSLTVKLSK